MNHDARDLGFVSNVYKLHPENVVPYLKPWHHAQAEDGRAKQPALDHLVVRICPEVDAPAPNIDRH
jgi:hypothetical protein